MIKLIDTVFDKEDGVSYAKISTDLGNFEGWAFLHPEDKDMASSYIGCELAECRATIDYYKAKITKVNIELNVLYGLRKSLRGTWISRVLNFGALDLIQDRINKKSSNKYYYHRCIFKIRKYINDKINARIEFIKKNEETKEDSE